MTSAPDFELDADEIVIAAVEIFEEFGLDAVSMRSVSARLGVSPIPLYSRVGCPYWECEGFGGIFAPVPWSHVVPVRDLGRQQVVDPDPGEHDE